jgi:glycerol kinase
MSRSNFARIPVVVAVDQGTSATKAVVIDHAGSIISRASVRVSRRDPRPGWVEQDPIEIRDSVIGAVETALDGLEVGVHGVGLSNQRESAVIWDRADGTPLGPLLGWQDRRTAPRAESLLDAGRAQRVRQVTGLPLDPMFSALKMQWLLDQVDPDRSRARAGRIAVGTVDSWLVWTLTGEHRIEMGNASRTQLLNLRTLDWDEELLELFDIPRRALPRLARSDEPTEPLSPFGIGQDARVCAVLGDSHAALYAHGARRPGRVKATYGSGSSLMGLLDDMPAEAAGRGAGLVRTIAWADPNPAYAFEGTILSTGATILWLADVLGITPDELSKLAQSTTDSGGVDLIPAFSGLGAPWWDDKAVATISGMGLGTSAAELAHAAFESLALQTDDVLAAAESFLGATIEEVLVDGGPTQNDWLMQKQADLSQRRVVRSNITELSATGAADLAGTACGFWTAAECAALGRDRSSFLPRVSANIAHQRRNRWHQAIDRSRLVTEGTQ